MRENFQTPNQLIDLHDLFLFTTASGYDLLQKEERRRSVLELEKMFFRVVTEVSPSLFVEAGAKDAATSFRARRHLPKARIVAFEANPFTFKRFNDYERFVSERVEYTHLALSDKNGSLTFNVRRIDGTASADGSGSILVSDQDSIPMAVDCRRLDSYFDDVEHSSIALWIDVEGANELVLSGAEGIFKNIDVVFIEVQDRPHWKGQWLTRDVMVHLIDRNFVPIARDYQSRYLYNIVFVRRELLVQPRMRHFLSEHVSQVQKLPGNRSDDRSFSVLRKLLKRVRQLSSRCFF